MPRPPDFWLFEHGPRWSATGFNQRISEFLRKADLFVGPEEGRDGKPFATGYKKDPVNAELLQLDFVEPDPEWVENPFARAAKMAYLAHPEGGGCDCHLLVGLRVPVVEPERPIQQQHIESEKAQDRPGTDHKKEHSGHEADAAKQQHQNQKTGAAQRAMRCQRR